jgi:SAM-dependent methyltransferase
MKFKHPHKYGLLAMVSKNDYKYLEKYEEKLDSCVEFYMEPDFFDDIAPQHLSLCYFSYPDKYSEEYVEKLVPKINAVVGMFLPLKVKVKGLIGGWDLGLDLPVVLWNIIDFEEINKFHDLLLSVLKKDIEHFNDSEMDFTPHIGVALGRQDRLEVLKQIVEESRKEAVIELTLDRLYIFYPNGPKEIYAV